MQSRPNPKVLIISTQTPASMQLKGFQPGRTGQMLQALTQGGLVHMHRNKSIKNDTERSIFTEHLESNGWVFITGHGDGGGVKGQYRMDDDHEEVSKNPLDIECSAEDYAKLLMSSNALKKGDHINVMVFVCHGGDENMGKESFARQLAAALFKAGISSHIIASSENVRRINEYTELNEIKGEQLKFRTDTHGIHIYDTGADGITKQTSPGEEIYIKKEGVFLASQLAMPQLTDSKLITGLQKIFGNQEGISQGHLNLTAMEAEYKISQDNIAIIFRKSSEKDKLAVTYYSPSGDEIYHTKFQYSVENINGKLEIRIKPEVVEQIRIYINSQPHSSQTSKTQLIDNQLLAGLQKIFGNYVGISKEYLNLTSTEADNVISQNKALIIFRKSSENEKLSITFYNPVERKIQHVKIEYSVSGASSEPELNLKPEFITAIKKMIEKTSSALQPLTLWQSPPKDKNDDTSSSPDIKPPGATR